MKLIYSSFRIAIAAIILLHVVAISFYYIFRLIDSVLA